MFNAKEVADLKERVTALEGDLAKATADHGTASAEVTRLTAELDSAKAALTAAQTDLTQHKTDLATANGRITNLETDLKLEQDKVTKAAADFEQRCFDEVNNRLSAAGVAPIARDPKVAPTAADTRPDGSALKGASRAAAAFNAQFGTGAKE